MPNIWWDRNRPSSVSQSHWEDKSPKTQTARAPIRMMTATSCHHTAEDQNGPCQMHLCQRVQTFLVEDFCPFSACTCEFDLWKNEYIYFKMRNEVRETTNFVKKKCNFQSLRLSAGTGCMLKLLLSNVGRVGWFRLHNTQSEETHCTHPHTIHSLPAWWCRRRSPRCLPGCQTWHRNCLSDRTRKPAPRFSGKQSLLEDNN